MSEQKLLQQEAYLEKLQDEEIKLYEKFEDDWKVQARAVYLKNLQEEEAKLFAFPIHLKLSSSSGEGVEEQDIEDHLAVGYECKACATYIKNLEEEEAKLFSLPIAVNVISVPIEPEERLEAHQVTDDLGRIELHPKQLDKDPKCEEDHLHKDGLRTSELDQKQLDKDDNCISKLKLHQQLSASPLCPSPEIQKAIIASRPLLSTMSSPMSSPKASSHGDQDDSDLASSNEHSLVMADGPIQQESTIYQEIRSSPQQEGTNRPEDENSGVLSIENGSNSQQEAANGPKEGVRNIENRCNPQEGGAHEPEKEVLYVQYGSSPQQEGTNRPEDENSGVLSIENGSNSQQEAANGPKEGVRNIENRCNPQEGGAHEPEKEVLYLQYGSSPQREGPNIPDEKVLKVENRSSPQQEATNYEPEQEVLQVENRSNPQQEGVYGPEKEVLNVKIRSNRHRKAADRCEEKFLDVERQRNPQQEGANGPECEKVLNVENRSNAQEEAAREPENEVLRVENRRTTGRTPQQHEGANGPEVEGVPNIDPRYQRRQVNRSVGTDHADRSMLWKRSPESDLEASTQTEAGLGLQAVQNFDLEAGRHQVRASFVKNLAELDAAIVHVHNQEDKMAKICSAAMFERAQDNSTTPTVQSPSLSRLAQAMGKSINDNGDTVEEEELESDVDSDELSFHETQEEFSMVDDSEWPSFAGSDVDSQQDDLYSQRTPGDHCAQRRWRSRDLGCFSRCTSKDFRTGVESTSRVADHGNTSTNCNSNFDNTDEKVLQTTSLRRRRSSSSNYAAIRARLLAGASSDHDEKCQQSSSRHDIPLIIPLNNNASFYDDEEQSRRPPAARRSSNSAILARLSAVASGNNSSGQLSRDASENDHTTISYPDQDMINLTTLMRATQSNNVEAISARLSEIARDEEQRSKDMIAPSLNNVTNEYDYRNVTKPFRNESSNTAILGRLSALVNGEGTIEEISAESSLSYENNRKETEKNFSPFSRRGSSSSSSSVILGRLSEVINNKEVTGPSPRESTFFGQNYMQDERFTPAARRRRSSSSSSSAILTILSTIACDHSINAGSSSSPREELLRTSFKRRSSSSGSSSAILVRFSNNPNDEKKSQQSDSDFGTQQKLFDSSDLKNSQSMRILTRRQSSGSVEGAEQLLLPKPVLEVPSREDEIQQFLKTVRVVVLHPSHDSDVVEEEEFHKRHQSASRRRSSSGETILARLSVAVGNKNASGDHPSKTPQLDQQHQDMPPVAKDETIQNSKRAYQAALPSNSSNYQVREMAEGSENRTKAVESSMQGIPNCDANGIGHYRSSSSFREPSQHQPPDDCTFNIELSPDANSELQQRSLTAQEREITKALAQLRQDSLDRMSALEQLQVPNFDDLAQKQFMTRESMARIQTVMGHEVIKGKQVVVPCEYLIGKEISGSSGTTRQRRDSGEKKIEVQRTWVALMEERDIAKALDQMSKENMGRAT
ncbi:unnamed protein product [Calypogeia fissa]